ncbi:hypothetical protein [Caballeronia sp. Sq4a]|uniref:hypothetical protein n=1 Tax=Caballeronia sp. Sq4a TaxID=2878152 RepID=UPI0020C0D9B9|nr:hypothetical protein [Caballeronia sp. Sq4a]
MTIYVSLPVHEAPLVVADQLVNFARFFPEACVVLHVSRSGRLDEACLRATLNSQRCENYLINPAHERTVWGSIFRAHLSNIAFIRSLGDASHVCFHASNDMLVAPGAAGHIARHGRGYNVRPITPGSYWWVSPKARADAVLDALCKTLGNCPLVGSQIEGAFYEADTVFEVADIARGAHPGEAGYPLEEVVFPTIAHAIGATPRVTPYVYSETHVFDRTYWRFLQAFEWLFGNNWRRARELRHCVEYAFIKTPYYRLSPGMIGVIVQMSRGISDSAIDDVQLARRLEGLQWMNDGDATWQVFDRHSLYGVKRVPRTLDNPLRHLIRQLPSARVPSAPERPASS